MKPCIALCVVVVFAGLEPSAADTKPFWDEFRVCGNYCGPNWCSAGWNPESNCPYSAQPTDDNDACCYHHDRCCSDPEQWKITGDDSCNSKLGRCLSVYAIGSSGCTGHTSTALLLGLGLMEGHCCGGSASTTWSSADHYKGATCGWSAQYKRSSNGYCDYGYSTITSKTDCERAATSLDLLDKVAGSGSSSSSPYGCYYRAASSSSSRLWLNLAGSGPSSSSERTVLCKKMYWPSSYLANSPTSEPIDKDDLDKANTEKHMAAVITAGVCLGLAGAIAAVIAKRRAASNQHNSLHVALVEADHASL